MFNNLKPIKIAISLLALSTGVAFASEQKDEEPKNITEYSGQFPRLLEVVRVLDMREDKKTEALSSDCSFPFTDLDKPLQREVAKRIANPTDRANWRLACRGTRELLLQGALNISRTVNWTNCTDEITDAQVVELILTSRPHAINEVRTFLSCKVTQACLRTLSERCHNLSKLTVEEGLVVGPRINDALMVKLIGGCPELSQIYFPFSVCRFTGEATTKLASLTKLIALDLGQQAIPNADIILLGKNNRRLNHLRLSQCRDLDDETAMSFAKECSSLSSLMLPINQKLTNKGLQAIVKSNEKLEALELLLELDGEAIAETLNWCLDTLSDNCPNLRSLELNLLCTQLQLNGAQTNLVHAQASFARLISKCEKLSSLDLSRCSRSDYNEAFISALKSLRPELVIKLPEEDMPDY